MTNSVPRRDHALTDAQMEELCNHLRGSCGSLEGALLSLFGMEQNGLTHEDEAEFDSMLFLCSICGWWCDTEGLSNDDGNQECEDCAGVDE
jgi:hypothetical protein